MTTEPPEDCDRQCKGQEPPFECCGGCPVSCHCRLGREADDRERENEFYEPDYDGPDEAQEWNDFDPDA